MRGFGEIALVLKTLTEVNDHGSGEIQIETGKDSDQQQMRTSKYEREEPKHKKNPTAKQLASFNQQPGNKERRFVSMQVEEQDPNTVILSTTTTTKQQQQQPQPQPQQPQPRQHL